MACAREYNKKVENFRILMCWLSSSGCQRDKTPSSPSQLGHGAGQALHQSLVSGRVDGEVDPQNQTTTADAAADTEKTYTTPAAVPKEDILFT
jgi:hypothetical protein